MSAADAAQEILRREQASPGSVPPALLAKAKGLVGAGQGSSYTLPEITVRGDSRDLMGRIFGGDVDSQGREMPPGGAFLPNGQSVDQPGKGEQFARQATGAAAVGANEYANAALLGLPQATGMTPGKDTPGYADLRAQHPLAAGAGQIAGLMNPANPANLVGGAVAGPVRSALGGSIAGRALAGGVEGATAGGVGAGAITAAGGGSGDQTFNAAATGAGVGGALGAAGSLVMEPGKWLRGILGGNAQPQAAPRPPYSGPENNQAIIDRMRMQALAPAPKPMVPQMGALDAPAPMAGPPRPPLGMQQAPPMAPPQMPDLELPPPPEPTAAAAPHAPSEPGHAPSLLQNQRPTDTGMDAIEARRALDTDALHMANRSAAVQKLVGIIPPNADSAWLSRMTADEKAKLADFVGVTQAGDETWRAVADALDARQAAAPPPLTGNDPLTVRAPPLPPEHQLAADWEANLRAGAMPAIPRAPRLPNMQRAGQRGAIDSNLLLAGIRAMKGMGSHGLGLDPSIEMMLQSRPLTNAVGIEAGTKLPQTQNRQPGQPPLDLLNLYGM